MKAAILETIDAPLTIGEVTVGQPAFGQVLVKVLVSGICGAQLQEIAGNKGNAKFVPHLLGHEGCGLVEAVGEGVTRVKKGDKVVMHWRKGEGIESDFPTYEYAGKNMPSGKVTTFSEYSLVSENRLTAVPHDTPDELCALLGCGLSTALSVINDEARVLFGESVLVIGAGGLGLNILQAANIARAYPIVTIDIHPGKKELAEKCGAHLFVDSTQSDIREVVQKTFGISDFNVIIDTSGNKKAIETTLPLLRGGGRYIMVGQPKPGEVIEISNAHHLFGGEGKSIRATQGGGFLPTTDIPRYINLYKTGVLHIDDVITHRIKLDQVNDAIDAIRSGMAGRIMIEMHV